MRLIERIQCTQSRKLNIKLLARLKRFVISRSSFWMCHFGAFTVIIKSCEFDELFSCIKSSSSFATCLGCWRNTSNWLRQIKMGEITRKVKNSNEIKLFLCRGLTRREFEFGLLWWVNNFVVLPDDRVKFEILFVVVLIEHRKSFHFAWLSLMCI